MGVTIDVQLLDRPVAYLPPPVDHPTSAGGEAVFIGRTRLETHPQHRTLVKLSYEAYRPMAEQVLHQLALVASDRFGCTFVRIHHAVCDVPPGAASVLVQTMCGHRGPAFESCRFVIDELKRTAPIWKREQWADGTSWSAGVPVLV